MRKTSRKDEAQGARDKQQDQRVADPSERNTEDDGKLAGVRGYEGEFHSIVAVEIGLHELGFPVTWTLRPGLWQLSDLVDRQHHQETEAVATLERGGVPKNPGANLGDGAGDGVAVKLPSDGRHPLALSQ